MEDATVQIKLANKRPGEIFPVTEWYSVEVERVVDGGAEFFVVECTLYAGKSRENARHFSLVFSFFDRLRQNGTEWFHFGSNALCVDYVTLGDPPLITFMLRVTAAAGRGDSLMGLATRGGDGSSDDDDDDTPPTEILLLGLRHDDTESYVTEVLPGLMHRMRRCVGDEAMADVVVFWENVNAAAVSNDVSLATRQVFFPAMLRVPLEGRFMRALQYAVSAYLMYVTPDEAERVALMMTHGYGREQRQQASAQYGPRGVEILLVQAVFHQLLYIAMNLGERRSVASLLPFFHDAQWIAQFIPLVAQFYEGVVLSQAARRKLAAARREYYARAQSTGTATEEWYYTEYFLNFLDNEVGITAEDAKRVASYATSFRIRLFYMLAKVVWFHRGGADDVGAASSSIDGVSAESVNQVVAQMVEFMARQNAWRVDERYFAQLSAVIFARFGNLRQRMSSLFALKHHKQAGENYTNIIRDFRDLHSLMHVTLVLRRTGVNAALLLVGSGHLPRLKEHFLGMNETSVHWVSDAATVTVVERQFPMLALDTDVPAVFQTYMALEEIDAWLPFRVASTGGGWRPRLQLFFYLTVSPNFYSKYFGSIEEDRHTLFFHAMRLFYALFVTQWPYDTGVAQYALPPDWNGDTLDAVANANTWERKFPPALQYALTLFDTLRIEAADAAGGEPVRPPGASFPAELRAQLNAPLEVMLLPDPPEFRSRWGFFMDYDEKLAAEERQRAKKQRQQQQENADDEQQQKKSRQ